MAVVAERIVVVPLAARGVADALLAMVGIPIGRRIHARLGFCATAVLRDMKGSRLICGCVVPLYREGDAIL